MIDYWYDDDTEDAQLRSQKFPNDEAAMIWAKKLRGKHVGYSILYKEKEGEPGLFDILKDGNKWEK